MTKLYHISKQSTESVIVKIVTCSCLKTSYVNTYTIGNSEESRNLALEQLYELHASYYVRLSLKIPMWRKKKRKICLKQQVCRSSTPSSGKVKDDTLPFQITYFSSRLIDVKDPQLSGFLIMIPKMMDLHACLSPLWLITGILRLISIKCKIVFLARIYNS